MLTSLTPRVLQLAFPFDKVFEMKIDPLFLLSASDWFINISAGWFGAAFIISALSKPPKRINLVWLTIDIVFAIFSFAIGVALKQAVRL